MNIGEMKENEMLCVIIDLWTALSQTKKEDIFIEYLKRKGLEKSEIDEYIDALNQFILEP